MDSGSSESSGKSQVGLEVSDQFRNLALVFALCGSGFLFLLLRLPIPIMLNSVNRELYCPGAARPIPAGCIIGARLYFLYLIPALLAYFALALPAALLAWRGFRRTFWVPVAAAILVGELANRLPFSFGLEEGLDERYLHRRFPTAPDPGFGLLRTHIAWFGLSLVLAMVPAVVICLTRRGSKRNKRISSSPAKAATALAATLCLCAVVAWLGFVMSRGEFSSQPVREDILATFSFVFLFGAMLRRSGPWWPGAQIVFAILASGWASQVVWTAFSHGCVPGYVCPGQGLASTTNGWLMAIAFVGVCLVASSWDVIGKWLTRLWSVRHEYSTSKSVGS